MGRELGVYQTAQPGSEEGPGHLREGEEQERPAPKCVDCPYCGKGEEEVNQAKAKRCIERLRVSCTGVSKDGRAIERNDVD